uniref:Uncharacterized protein n=1 Tax=Panagrolaimus sp. PS1159 TaxID=55785 RepID=A0AC35G587_9BILA
MLLKINSNTYVCDYNNNEISLNKFTLTKRYQTVENIRTLRAIIWFLIYSTLSNAVTVGFHIFNNTYFNEFTDKELYALCEELWYLINSIVATLLPLPFILKHSDIKKHFM